jgi:hypothetical protein
MSSNSSSKETLLATAIAAATAGAAIAYTAIKLNDKKNGTSSSTSSSSDKPKSLAVDPSEGRGQKNSLIYGNNENKLTNDSRADSGILFPHNHEEKMRRRIAARVSVEEENMTPRQSVTVRVPATSANVGPGCKCRNRTVQFSTVQ